MSNNRKTLAYLSYGYIAIIWGTTYLAIQIAVKHLPPFLMSGVRQIISSAIMCGLAYAINRNVDLRKRNLLQNVIIGLLMIAIGNGIVSWAVKLVPSGVAALICSTMPISVVCINLLSGKSEKPNLLVVAGMILGVLGVAMIFRQDVAAQEGYPYFLIGILSLLVGTFGWGAGSVLSQRWGSNKNPMFDSGIQLLSGGIILTLVSPLLDNYNEADWFNTDAWLSFVYLIVFGSVIAFTLYRYALKELPVGFVTSYAYVNPLVAVLLGWKFAGEPLNQWVAYSFVAIIGGVFLVNSGYQKKKKKDALVLKGNRETELT